MKTAVIFGCVILVAVLAANLIVIVHILDITPVSDYNDLSEHYLMPNPGSEAHKNWIENYGDTPESWLAFTAGFHTRYLQQVDARIKALTAKLAAYPDPNDIVKVGHIHVEIEIDPNDILRVETDPNAPGTVNKED